MAKAHPRPANAPAGVTTPRQSTEKHAGYDASPPYTPPSQVTRVPRGRGGLKAPRVRPSVRDAFEGPIGDTLVGGSSKHGEHVRHRSSHDLSWSPRQARDSVVDNMLLSLDRLGEPVPAAPRPAMPGRTLYAGAGDEEQGETGADDEAYADARSYAPVQGRPRGHTYASSFSSGYSAPADPNRSPQSRGHRSNSSTGGFHSSLGRIDSLRSTSKPDPRLARQNSRQDGGVQAADTLEGVSTPVRTPHRRGASSPDIAQALDSAPWQRNRNRRSASFDHSVGQAMLKHRDAALASVTPAERSFFYGEIDAAPTPTVHGGPRRAHSPTPSSRFRPGSSVQSLKPVVSRRGSLRAPFSLFGRGDKDSSLDHHVIKPAARGIHVQTNSGSNPVRLASSPILPVHPPSLRAPSSTSNMPASNVKERERPGFFRRVFGSRNSTPTHHDTPSASHKQTTPSGLDHLEAPKPQFANENRAKSRAHSPSPHRASSKERQPLKEHPPQVLNKKSSFFRRRRKSVSEATPVPAVPTQPVPQTHGPAGPQGRDAATPAKPQTLSPTSSLRKVMNPYLESSGPGSSQDPQKHQNLHVDPPMTAEALPSKPFNEVDRVMQHYERGGEAGFRWHGSEQVPARPAPSFADAVAGRRSQESGRPRASTGHSRAPSDVHKDLPALPHEPSALEEAEGLYMRPTPTRAATKPTSDLAERPLPKVRQTRRSSRQDRPERPTLSPLSTGPDVLSDSARASASTLSDYRSATSKIASPAPEAEVASPVVAAPEPMVAETHDIIADPAPAVVDDPTFPSPDDHALAEKLLDGQAEGISKAETVAHLGGTGPERARVRRAFVERFDWRDASILTALRDFCARVALRGETQQVDRVLDALARRWCACNPHHGFQAADVVHTVCYSLLLLNTDLHLADIDSRMTRTQFIRNTMPTIRRVVLDAAPDAFESGRGSMLPPPRSPMLSPVDSRPASNTAEAADGVDISKRPTAPQRNDTQESGKNLFLDTAMEDCGPLVKKPFHGKISTWESQVEAVLRGFYQSIRQERLPLHGSNDADAPPMGSQPSSTGLAAMGGTMLRRTNSMLSKAGSETFPSRGRHLDAVRASLAGGSSSRWSSKVRSRPRLYPASVAHSRTSFDDGGADTASAISPSGSSLWSSSRFSLGKTQTSMSAASFASERSSRGGDYQQSIGFANALSQAIIREEAAAVAGTADAGDDDDDDGPDEAMRAAPLLEDESLELAGAPWAKEGLLKHKRHLDAADRRAKDRTWTDCFAVVEKGWMRLFQFPVGSSSRSLRHKSRAISGGRHNANNAAIGGGGGGGGGGSGGPVVGGGNWIDNAQPLGQFPLRHTLASALPPPGYSKARPHVWALSLPTGAVHLFHAGTAEIVREFVAAANYWSARLSKEPLVGGVSNVEYGWSERIINLALLAGDARPPSTVPSTAGGSMGGSAAAPRPSLQSSIRSSFDHSVSGGARPKLPGDKVPISDWSPPSQSMLASQLLEVDQLKALSAYVRNVEEELRKHNELRGAILLAVRFVLSWWNN